MPVNHISVSVSVPTGFPAPTVEQVSDASAAVRALFPDDAEVQVNCAVSIYPYTPPPPIEIPADFDGIVGDGIPS